MQLINTYYILITIITPTLSRLPESISHCISHVPYGFFIPKMLNQLFVIPFLKISMDY